MMITHNVVLFADSNESSAPIQQAHAMTKYVTGHKKQAVETKSYATKKPDSKKHSWVQSKHFTGWIKRTQQYV